MEYKKIPSKMRIGGHDLDIKIVDRCEDYICGNCCLATGMLNIGQKVKAGDQSESSQVNTFYHELTHLVLDTMGRSDLSSDETFVCSFAGFLSDAMTNAYFKEE